jgi:predicted nucleotide-binding protein
MARTDSAPKEPPKAAQPGKKRVYVKQADIPATSLMEALRVPIVIAEQFGKQPTPPAQVALVLDLLPKGSQFELLTGSAIAYGLTEGGSKAESIGLTDLGKRIVSPLVEGEDVAGMREAFLRPRIISDFLRRYDGSTLPTDERVGRNVLEDLGVPPQRGESTLAMIVEGAAQLGLITEVRGKQVVSLQPVGTRLHVVPEPEPDESEETDVLPAATLAAVPEMPMTPEVPLVEERNRKVFVSHGSNRKIVEQLKGLLEFGEFEPVISVERETTSKPVPDKVMDDMRACGAGIIHVGVERVLLDADGNEHPQLNSNVLIEIGAAMQRYGRNFILLVEEGTKLPSNLQGLYEVRYEGATLDADATMRLLKAFKSFKS